MSVLVAQELLTALNDAISERDAEIERLRQQVAELEAYKQRVIDADKRVIRKVIDEEVDD